MAGQAYVDGDTTYTVAYNAGLKITYAIASKDGEVSGYIYNGKQYNTNEELADAVVAASLL